MALVGWMSDMAYGLCGDRSDTARPWQLLYHMSQCRLHFEMPNLVLVYDSAMVLFALLMLALFGPSIQSRCVAICYLTLANKYHFN